MENKKHVVLGIESSCDEAAIGIVSEGKVLYQDLYSSAKVQAQFGGVIPEIASRLHEENMQKMLAKLVKDFDVSKITDIVYTARPGLIGGLHVANTFAKTLGWQWGLHPIGVSHIGGHIFSAAINQKDVKYPFLALVVSGKTSSIFKVSSASNITQLVCTTDDAAGECLDKIGRRLGIDYPAGKTIDETYRDDLAIVPLIEHSGKNENFSFSGFKTHVLTLINNNSNHHKYTREQIAASAMKWITEEMVRKLHYWATIYHIHNVFVGGGVSASQTLKHALEKEPWIRSLHMTDLKYTGDNGVMMAYYGEKYLQDNDERPCEQSI